MDSEKILKKSEIISKIPEYGTDEYKKFFEQKEFLQLLFETSIDEIPLFMSYKGIYIYSVIFPQSKLKGYYIDDLLKWQCSPDRTWGYGYFYNKRGKTKSFISQPYDSAGSELLKKASPITFSRYFEGRIGQKSYVEVSQLLTHPHNLHFLEERKAYCGLDEDGDIEEVIKIVENQEYTLVTIKQDILDFHLFLTKSVLLRFFDRTLFMDKLFIKERSRQESTFRDQESEIYARGGIVFNEEKLPIESWLRGFQIIRNRQPLRKMIANLTDERLTPIKYEKFIAWDWKHKRIAESSCDPEELGNYFVKSDKPYETSPVFFKPEVLLKYKQNPEKYTIKQRSITCRGSWHLQTYDINKAGQVFTYLIYLGDLPHSEQLYWKSFNEEPKSGISERAFKADFKGEWDLPYEPLSELKESLKKLENEKSELWSCKKEELYEHLNYSATDSIKEWEDEILNLEQLVIEGFKHEYLKRIATSLSCYNAKAKLGSIKLLKEILKAKKISEQEVNSIISPLEDIHFLRSIFSAHISGDKADIIRRKLVAQHGSLKKHFRNLIERTDNAIKTLLEISFG